MLNRSPARTLEILFTLKGFMKLFILILLSSCSSSKTKLKDIPYLINSIGNEVKYGEFRDDSSEEFI